MSISSLSSKIYYSHYYKDECKLPILTGYLEKSLRESFYGGLSDVIRPFANKNIKSFDFVSMYPSVMVEKAFPVGNPIFTTNKNLDQLFGVVEAIIIAPAIHVSVLPFKALGSNVVITPTGNWGGKYCTELLKKVREIGYIIGVV